MIIGELIETNENYPIQNIEIYFQDSTLDNYSSGLKEERLILQIDKAGPFRDKFSYWWGRMGSGDIENYRRKELNGEFFIIIRASGYCEKKIPMQLSALEDKSDDKYLVINLGEIILERTEIGFSNSTLD